MRVERNKSGRGRGRGRSSTRNFGNKKKSSTTLSSDKKQYKFATQQSGTNAQQYQIYDKVMEKLKAYVAKSFGEHSLDILNCIEGESYDSFENDEPIEQVFEAPVLPRLIPNDAEGNETKRMEYDFKSKEYILLVESSKREYHTKSERYDKRQNGTKDKTRKIDATGNISVIKWMIDESFAVHPDLMSHTGGTMHFDEGKGAVQAVSRKQHLNSKSSTRQS